MGRDKGLIHEAPYNSVSALSKLREQRLHSCRKSQCLLKVPSSLVPSEPLSPAYLERAGKFSVEIQSL